VFFTKINVTNTGGATSAGKFNRQGLNKALLSGIGPKVARTSSTGICPDLEIGDGRPGVNHSRVR
jgi:hypothetical protein